MSASRDVAIQYLRTYWWNQTAMSALGFTTFPDAVAHYDRLSPGFLESIGGVVRGMQQDKVKAGWAKVAKEYKTAYPPIGAFYDALAASTLTFSAQDAKEVALETASDVAKAATFGLGGAALLAGLGGVIWLAVSSGSLAKGLKGFKKARAK